jgi:drug/metabolite transporter (DMT)-like permease
MGGTTFGVLYLPSSMAALLVAAVPLFLAVLGWLSGQTARPTAWVALGLAAGVAGMYLLATHSGTVPPTVQRPGHTGLGMAFVLTAAFVWSVGSLYSKKHQPAPSPFLSGGMQMLCGGLVMLLAGLLRGESAGFELAQVTAKSWLAYAYLVSFGSIVAFTAYIWLLRVVEPPWPARMRLLTRWWQWCWAGAFGGERLSVQMLGGAALIVLAVGLVVLGGRRPAGAR